MDVLVSVILACEVGFWVLLALGLVARHVLRLRRTSVALLASVPVVDLVLLAATVVDLQRGGVATPLHGLAAAYIAFSVVFGHQTIRAVDVRVAHRFAGGPEPVRAPRTGPAAVRAAWVGWAHGLAAWCIATGLLTAAVLLIGDPSRSRELVGWIRWLSVALGSWFVLGPLAAHVLGRRVA